MRNGYADYAVAMGFYDRNGDPMPMMCWARMTNTPYREVARTAFGPDGHDALVHTIWQGVPAPILRPLPYLIFSTLVRIHGSPLDGTFHRSSTLQEAIEMHDMFALTVAHELESW